MSQVQLELKKRPREAQTPGAVADTYLGGDDMKQTTRVCEAPIQFGPNRGLPASATGAGRQRHWVAGEEPCDDCVKGLNSLRREWRAANPEKVRAANRTDYLRHRERRVAAIKRYKQQYPEKARALSRSWRERNAERERETKRAYYEKNKVRIRQNHAAWREANADKMRELVRAWSLENRERLAEYSRQRRARVREALIVPFTQEQLDARLSVWGYKCWMCGGPFGAVDHVILLALGGPHCLSNLRPACVGCNSSKGAKHHLEFL